MTATSFYLYAEEEYAFIEAGFSLYSGYDDFFMKLGTPLLTLICGLLLAGCASHSPAPSPAKPVATSASLPSPAKANTPNVITVAKNGNVEVNARPVPLNKLSYTLKEMGLSKKSKFTVEGESGTDMAKIDFVLETLVQDGYLPKNTID